MRERSAAALLAGLVALTALAAAKAMVTAGAAPRAVTATPAPSLAAPTTTRARFLMGTRLVVTLPGAVADEVFDQAFAEVARLERVLSNWDSDSELSRLNRAAADGTVRCSDDLFVAVSAARHWAEMTGGAFDPTVEPLVRRFGLRGDEGRLEPARQGLAGSGAAAPADRPNDGPVGWQHLHLDPLTRSIRFDAPGVGIDLGGIGKGIALDAAARVLGERAIRAALLDFGGQVLATGSGPGGAWPVGIAGPGDRDSAALWIVLRGSSLASSGNGERSGPDGLGHILDPARGAPAGYAGTVTVLAPDATAADALSTALFVMGPDRGLPWAEQHGIGVLYQWPAADGTAVRRLSRNFPAFSEGGPAAEGRTP